MPNLNPFLVGSEPFPFAIIDNVLPAEEFAGLIDKLPKMKHWYHYSSPLEEKYAFNNKASFPEAIQDLVRFMNTPETCEQIAEMLELTDQILMPDPILLGAGLHRIPRGGKLDLHLDHNRNKNLPGLERRVNAIYWFHPVWDPGWGGSLELWSAADGKPSCEAIAIEPKPNRMALFKACDISFHGHPDPLTCPQDVFRTSLAMYYYSNKPEDKQERLKVHFYPRPCDPPSPELDSLRARRANPDTAAQAWKS